jgi:hypothetical protein
MSPRSTGAVPFECSASPLRPTVVVALSSSGDRLRRGRRPVVVVVFVAAVASCRGSVFVVDATCSRAAEAPRRRLGRGSVFVVDATCSQAAEAPRRRLGRGSVLFVVAIAAAACWFRS